MIEIIILVIPVALVFYLIGKWLKESVKKDEAKEKERNIAQKQSAPEKEHHIFNIILIIMLAIIGLWFLASVITDFGRSGNRRCDGATEEECRVIEAIEGSR